MGRRSAPADGRISWGTTGSRWLSQEAKMSAEEVERLIAEGEALVQQEHYEEALAAFEQALIVAPQDAVARHGKGLALAKLNHLEEARAAFEQAIALDSKYARAWRNLG